MSSAHNVSGFIEALKLSGVVITEEARLVERLARAHDAGDELVRIAGDSRGTGVSFSVDQKLPADKLTKAFSDNGFDGFTFHHFIPHLKLI